MSARLIELIVVLILGKIGAPAWMYVILIIEAAIREAKR